MKIRFGARSFLVSVLAVGGAALRLCACSTTDETIVIGETNFDGRALGTCSGDASKIIPASDCPTLCPLSQARALCVGNVYSECSCITTTTSCDSGCCFPSAVSCEDSGVEGGKVAMTDPTYGESALADGGYETCDSQLGYLLCNGTCYATFSCELPPEYTLLAPPDAGRDAGPDGLADSALSDAPVDVVTDSGFDANGLDASGDAARDGGSDGAAEAGTDARGEASSDGGASGDT
jgi:hypothetical protein